MSIMILLSFLSTSGKLPNQRLVCGNAKIAAGVASEGGFGDLPNLAILLFRLLKAEQEMVSGKGSAAGQA